MDDDFFRGILDDQPADAGARLLYAEHLAETGDPLADGVRWLAETGRWPYRAYSTWDWWHADSSNPAAIRLPTELWDALPVSPARGFPRCKEFPTRAKAEAAVAELAPHADQ